MSFRAFAARSLLSVFLAGGVAMPAMAQHVVTDDEAGKLTFDALTATPAPIVHRVVYRSVSRRSISRTIAARTRMGSTTTAAVRTVAYRHPAHGSGSHVLAKHGKARRG